MAIDQAVLDKQRLSLVTRPEGRCDRCGKRTRDKTGTCMDCRNEIPDLRRCSTQRLKGLMDACKAELKRRSDEIAAALEG